MSQKNSLQGKRAVKNGFTFTDVAAKRQDGTQHSHSVSRRQQSCMAQGNRRGAIFQDDDNGSDARKVLLADLLWRRTVVSQEWLAEKLAMKSAANVSQQMRRLARKNALAAVPESLRLFLHEADASP